MADDINSIKIKTGPMFGENIVAPPPSIPSFAGGVSGVFKVLRQDFIKFDPEKIMEMSTKLEQQHKKLVKSAESIRKRSETLMGSWQSDSSELYLEKLKDLDTQSVTMAEKLSRFSLDLAAASGVYKTGEADAKKQAEALPTDGVFLV